MIQFFKGLREASRYSYLDKFNKAAGVTVPVVTGYYLSGKTGAATALLAYIAGFLKPLPKPNEETVESIRRWTRGVYDEKTYIGRQIKAFQEEVGIHNDVEVIVVNTEQPPFVMEDDEKTTVVLPLVMANTFPDEELLEIVRHELGHVEAGDTLALNRMRVSGQYAWYSNLVVGGLRSLLQMSFLPALTAAASGLGQRALFSFTRRNAEMRADAFVARHGDPGRFASGLFRMSGSPQNIFNAAVGRYEVHTAELPAPLARFLEGRHIPQFALRIALHMDRALRGTHPPMGGRIRKMVGEAQSREPEEMVEFRGFKELRLCSHCMVDGKGNEGEEQSRVSVYVRDQYRSVYGHPNVAVEFADVCAEREQAFYEPYRDLDAEMLARDLEMD